MIVGFTGTQVGMSPLQLEALRRALLSFTMREFHHGDCIGADAQAHDVIRWIYKASCVIHIHPPINKTKRAFKTGDVIHNESAYLDRNKVIVNICDLLIATPKTTVEELRSGTWSTIRYARKTNKKLCIIYPDGTGAIERK